MQIKMIMITINFWIFYWLLNMNNMQSICFYDALATDFVCQRVKFEYILKNTDT